MVSRRGTAEPSHTGNRCWSGGDAPRPSGARCLGTPGPVRQLLYVTGEARRHDKLLRRHRSTAIADLTLKLLVGRVGLEPTTGGL